MATKKTINTDTLVTQFTDACLIIGSYDSDNPGRPLTEELYEHAYEYATAALVQLGGDPLSDDVMELIVLLGISAAQVGFMAGRVEEAVNQGLHNGTLTRAWDGTLMMRRPNGTLTKPKRKTLLKQRPRAAA